jgi:hypothetical protein
MVVRGGTRKLDNLRALAHTTVGARCHLVGGRLSITGARWGLTGAEAVLLLRTVHSNGDLDN